MTYTKALIRPMGWRYRGLAFGFRSRVDPYDERVQSYTISPPNHVVSIPHRVKQQLASITARNQVRA